MNSKIFNKLKSRGSLKNIKTTGSSNIKFEISSLTNYIYNLLIEILEDTP